ncbi:uncharacterized protein L199_004079 [Kwoniella botswanensis]|uniref:uncharacterized protein n=1 Tax=Kwoniella botswanensis TaxID=1268659 RepID=UPI00315DCBF8
MEPLADFEFNLPEAANEASYLLDDCTTLEFAPETGADSLVFAEDNLDHLTRQLRAEAIRNSSTTIEQVREAFQMTEDEEITVMENIDYDNYRFPPLYEPLNFLEMKAALGDGNITDACRSAIITVLYQQHFKEELVGDRAYMLKTFSDPSKWIEISSEERSQIVISENMPSEDDIDTPTYAAKQITVSEGDSEGATTLTAEGIAVYCMISARKFAEDLHRDISNYTYSTLSDVPQEVLSMVPTRTVPQISASWDSVHRAYEIGLNQKTRESILNAERHSRLETFRNWPVTTL